MPDNELYNPTPERPKESCGLQGIESCESVFYQTETVCVPVSVTPFATPGIAKATCSGKPVISNKPCKGSKTSCTFSISQKLCIQIPVSFGAVIETDAAMVQCGEVSEESCECHDHKPKEEEYCECEDMDAEYREAE